MRGKRWKRRCAALAVLAPALLLLPALCSCPRAQARASVSVAVSFDSLVRSATAVVLATPVEQLSVWEGGRIYTYSRVRVDSAVAGDLAVEGIAWVRTMGGVVDDVGQRVDGEAELTVGRPSLLFLRRDVRALSPTGPRPAETGLFVVAARAQGQFGLYADEASRLHVRRSSSVGALVLASGATAPVPLAADVLDGRAVADAARDIAAAWGRAHAP